MTILVFRRAIIASQTLRFVLPERNAWPGFAAHVVNDLKGWHESSYKLTTISSYSGAEGLRASENKFIFHTRASYAEEAEQLIVQGLWFGMKTVAISYQDNDFGKAALMAGIVASLLR